MVSPSLSLPSQTPCLHAIAVGSGNYSSKTSTDNSASSRLIWLAVSGLSSPTPTLTRERSTDDGAGGGGDEMSKGEDSGGGGPGTVYLGPLSRLLSVCAERHVLLHNIDLTSVLASMIGVLSIHLTAYVNSLYHNFLSLPIYQRNCRYNWSAGSSGSDGVATLRPGRRVHLVCHTLWSHRPIPLCISPKRLDFVSVDSAIVI